MTKVTGAVCGIEAESLHNGAVLGFDGGQNRCTLRPDQRLLECEAMQRAIRESWISPKKLATGAAAR
jgi:hypothetical protein